MVDILSSPQSIKHKWFVFLFLNIYIVGHQLYLIFKKQKHVGSLLDKLATGWWGGGRGMHGNPR